MALLFDGLALAARGDTAAAIATLTTATERERGLPLWSGPYWGVPAGELLANLLLRAGRAREAADAFTNALAQRSNAAAPLLGRARASWAAGDRQRAAADYCQLATNWVHADRDLPALAEVRARASCPPRGSVSQ